MRAISLVNRIEFEFRGNVARNAIVLGDLDNDGSNELVIGSDNGKVAIFKGRKNFQVLSNFSFVSCIAIGDIFNEKSNNLVIVTADGWCYIYKAVLRKKVVEFEETAAEDVDTVDGQVFSGESTDGLKDEHFLSGKFSKEIEDEDEMVLTCVHTQRIPANSKDILLADVDGDGALEMVLGLTDRVVRSYKWIPNVGIRNKSFSSSSSSEDKEIKVDNCLGKLVALNKWECANQIGSITLHHSEDGHPSLLIAQPGGTFMRIRCPIENPRQDFENSETSTISSSSDSTSSSLVDYQYLGISRMRNRNISTEILGDFRTSRSKIDGEEIGVGESRTDLARPYALATLDGTIMLVRNEVILWAMAVDHQIFALTKLDVTGTGSDDIVVCSWDGQTYILDQDKNSVRFHLEQPVQAFNSGYYNLSQNEPPVTCLVYVTFKNTVIIYYDIPLKDLNCRKFEPDLSLLAEKLENEEQTTKKKIKDLSKNTKKSLVSYLLYNSLN
ncbi:KICSTOR complex protein ITFG2 isoform X1 [Coccinella septempunctata]|uniref:KICSTOR complex protein ITFG2 isoform X1 n=1 Tax=Coccinella septempunctata TaxID=41139 RepID=UPI001D07F7CA|nr:KICSTOR complex protein ITFG2 isoform X1 [Coccinella septempunctata]XP_044750159.1 KICSTOR complex protein ITFG2 isoform X1 [Coccinella septempunctata]